MIKDGIVLTASKAVSGSDKAFVYQYYYTCIVYKSNERNRLCR